MRRIGAALVVAALFLGAAPEVRAASAEEIDIRVDAAIGRFAKEVSGGEAFLKSSKGILVFPNVTKAGFIFGGEYGEGALRIAGATVDYYSTAAASWGLQIGAQSKAVYLVFMDQAALDKFRRSSGWKAGVDGSVSVIKLGAGGAIDSTNLRQPIVGFILTNKGLMANLTFEGSKYTKLNKTRSESDN